MQWGLVLCALISAQSFAVTWDELKIGKAVELTSALDANQRMSWASLHCRIADHVVWPKVKVGPGASDVDARYFVVAWKSVDPFTYSVDLISEQMPCGCVLRLDQTPAYLHGAGSDFKTVTAVDPKLLASVRPVSTACSNLPDWVTGSESSPHAVIEDWGHGFGL